MRTEDLQPTAAFDAKSADGSVRAVAIFNLRVVISVHEGSWFAQGMEIDYAAQGSSVEEVKKAFERGLALTIGEHLRIFGNVEKLLKPAHAEAWAEFYAAKQCAQYHQISVHKFGELKIEYLEAAA